MTQFIQWERDRPKREAQERAEHPYREAREQARMVCEAQMETCEANCQGYYDRNATAGGSQWGLCLGKCNEIKCY